MQVESLSRKREFKLMDNLKGSHLVHRDGRKLQRKHFGVDESCTNFWEFGFLWAPEYRSQRPTVGTFAKKTEKLKLLSSLIDKVVRNLDEIGAPKSKIL